MLLDTHSLLWLTHDENSLSNVARERLNKSLEQKVALFCLSASFWEIAVKCKKRKIDIGMSSEQFLELCNEAEGLEIVETTATDWILSAQLDWAHRDPIDRLLVATAARLDTEIVTCDDEIRNYYSLCVW